jgi:hypothetical protein
MAHIEVKMFTCKIDWLISGNLSIWGGEEVERALGARLETDFKVILLYYMQIYISFNLDFDIII